MENKIKINKRGEKFIKFFKHYGYYILAGAIILAITLTVVLTAPKSSNLVVPPNNETPAEPVDAYALTFTNPLEESNIVKNHSTDKLVYDTTLGWFATHHGIDLVSEKSSDVLAAAEGVVSEIYTNDLEGTVIVIKHNDVYTSKYGSLNSQVEVKVGDKVKKGQKIGTVSTSAKNEVATGAHLHFELFVDNEDVNPADYLSLENK